MRRAVIGQGLSKNLALEALQQRAQGPHDAPGGPLNGWNLSPADLALFQARHPGIQERVAEDVAGS